MDLITSAPFLGVRHVATPHKLMGIGQKHSTLWDYRQSSKYPMAHRIYLLFNFVSKRLFKNKAERGKKNSLCQEPFISVTIGW